MCCSLNQTKVVFCQSLKLFIVRAPQSMFYDQIISQLVFIIGTITLLCISSNIY